MNLAVVISRRAAEDIQDSHDWWAEHRSPEQAARWYDGILSALDKLAVTADRCVKPPEACNFPFDVRQLNFGLGRQPSHRVLFTIRPECVYILAVRHVSQQHLGPDDLV